MMYDNPCNVFGFDEFQIRVDVIFLDIECKMIESVGYLWI